MRFAVVLTVLVGACTVTGILLPDIKYSSWLDKHGSCRDGYNGHQVMPYGEVYKCIPLDSEIPIFGEPDARAWVLLETERGLVVLRVDYRNTDAGRQYTASAFEVSPQDVPDGLSSEQARQLAADVAARGGVREHGWGLHAGDG